tara:strand:- start:32 stop:952 length:921 start_codon:yes stop_codon:yes gene_type:complete
MKRFLKYLFYPFEAFFFIIVVLVGLIIPFSWGSALGGYLFGVLGPLLTQKTQIAHRNFQLAGLDFTKEQQDQILKKMWQNLGRTFLEYIRLPYQKPFGKKSPYTIEGLENLEALIQDQKPGLLFSAHYGNWEVGTYIAQKRGLKTAQITRFLNNPLTRFLVNTVHGRIARKIIPKGSEGAKEIMKELKLGHHVSMLADQKMNDGMAAPFFGRDAMTAPAFARMALKFDCPILPFQAIRTDGIKCKVIYYPPLVMPKTGTDQEKTISILKQMNNHIEGWIRDHPEQWFWIHRRWPKDLYGFQESKDI